MYNRQLASIKRVVILYKEKCDIVDNLAFAIFLFLFNAFEALNVYDKSIYYRINIKCNDFYSENKYDSC